MTKELATEKKNVKDIQSRIEDEILQRVTAENKLQSLKENFKFKEEVNLKHFYYFLNVYKSYCVLYRYISNNSMIQE